MSLLDVFTLAVPLVWTLWAWWYPRSVTRSAEVRNDPQGPGV